MILGSKEIPAWEYIPWPDNGCSVPEARRRTADPALWKRRCELLRQVEPNAGNRCSAPSQSDRADIEKTIEANFVELLTTRRLIPYGRPGSQFAKHVEITTTEWPEIAGGDWERVSLADQDTFGFFDVRMYPPILAPCRGKLVDGRSLIDVFRRDILCDPEVEALGREALRLLPDFKDVFKDGHWFPTGVKEWPLCHEIRRMPRALHPDPARRWYLACRRDPDPIEVVVALEAMDHRFDVLISSLQSRECEAIGLPPKGGPAETILVSIWSHRDFSFEPSNGDILQSNPESTSKYDQEIVRWLGVVLRAGPHAGVAVPEVAKKQPPAPVQRLDETRVEAAASFHVKPTTFDEVRPTTVEHQEFSSPHAKGVARVRSTAAAQTECKKWLIEIFEACPDIRKFNNDQLWAMAKAKWPNTLSARSFFAARKDAILAARAPAWGSAGAPRKSKQA